MRRFLYNDLVLEYKKYHLLGYGENEKHQFKSLFHTTGLFLDPLKNQKTSGFLMFSGGKERAQ